MRVWTSDLLTQRKLCHSLPMSIRRYTLSLGAPTVIEGEVSLDAPDHPVPLLPERKSVLWIEEDEVLVAGGIVWTTEPNLRSRTLRVSAAGPLSYLDRRRIPENTQFENIDQFEIVRTLVDAVQGASAGDIHLQVRPDTDSGVKRDRSYAINKYVGEAIAELSRVENGFDLREEFAYDAQQRPTWALRLGYPFLGRVYPQLLWYREIPGQPLAGNIAEYRWPSDGASSANHWLALGAGTGSGQLIASAIDTTETDAGYPQLDGISSYLDVIEPETLAAHAAEDLRIALGNRVVPVITLRGEHAPAPGKILPGDFARVRLTSCYHLPGPGGRPGVDSYFRVVQVQVTPASRDAVREVVLTMAPISVGPPEVM
jgi:hypothetical protein